MTRTIVVLITLKEPYHKKLNQTLRWVLNTVL